ncbi:hypothetical protein B0H19DRAFT_197285 [Mycena capillaripes]|nr:hypothetical protein B0H19DRAFT_197285 [Mycena capillaripes]
MAYGSRKGSSSAYRSPRRASGYTGGSPSLNRFFACSSLARRHQEECLWIEGQRALPSSSNATGVFAPTSHDSPDLVRRILLSQYRVATILRSCVTRQLHIITHAAKFSRLAIPIRFAFCNDCACSPRYPQRFTHHSWHRREAHGLDRSNPGFSFQSTYPASSVKGGGLVRRGNARAYRASLTTDSIVCLLRPMVDPGRDPSRVRPSAPAPRACLVLCTRGAHPRLGRMPLGVADHSAARVFIEGAQWHPRHSSPYRLHPRQADLGGQERLRYTDVADALPDLSVCTPRWSLSLREIASTSLMTAASRSIASPAAYQAIPLLMEESNINHDDASFLTSTLARRSACNPQACAAEL